MAAQITPNDEALSPNSPNLAQLHARPDTDEPAEDRENGHDEVWSDGEGEEEGPKRKRPRPLSASCSMNLTPLFFLFPPILPCFIM